MAKKKAVVTGAVLPENYTIPEVRTTGSVQRENMTKYGLSINLFRAIPSVIDGLKTGLRRVLFSANEMKLTSNKPFKKAANLVGYTMANYAPHGDASIYDAAVRMSRDWVMGIPLIDKHGNNGTISGKKAAAQRYLELRLSPIANAFFRDMNEQTVEFVPNFDKQRIEPLVLPVSFPNILINGTTGMGWGFSTNVASFNPAGVYAGLKYVAEAVHGGSAIDEIELMSLVGLPDFPTGGIIVNPTEAAQAVITGKGRVIVRANITVDYDNNTLYVTDLPPLVDTSRVVDGIVEYCKEGNNNESLGVVDVRDLTSKHNGVSVMVKFKRDTNMDTAVSILTTNETFNIQSTFPYNAVLLNATNTNLDCYRLATIFVEFVEFRSNVLLNKASSKIAELHRKAHTLEALLMVNANPDAFINCIRNSNDRPDAIENLIKMGMSYFQAEEIVDTRLSFLAKLSKNTLEANLKSTQDEIAVCEKFCADPKAITNEIVQNAYDDLKPYFCERRTSVAETELVAEERDNPLHNVEPKDILIIVGEGNKVKRVDIDSYRIQKRGGKGRNTSHEVVNMISCNTHDELALATNTGKMFIIHAYEIPEKVRGAGATLNSLIGKELGAGEDIISIHPISKTAKYFLFVTKKGKGKRVLIDEFTKSNRNGLIAIVLEESDSICSIFTTSDEGSILMSADCSRVTHVAVSEFPTLGRATMGNYVFNVRSGPNEGAEVTSASFVLPEDENQAALTISKQGFGKLTMITDYPMMSRDTMGIDPFARKFDMGIAYFAILDNLKLADESVEAFITITSSSGKVIKIPMGDLPVLARPAKGNMVINLDEGETVTAVAVSYEKEND